MYSNVTFTSTMDKVNEAKKKKNKTIVTKVPSSAINPLYFCIIKKHGFIF